MESILNFFSEYLSRGDFMELFAANININTYLFTFLYKITPKYRLRFFAKKFKTFFFFFLFFFDKDKSQDHFSFIKFLLRTIQNFINGKTTLHA